MTTEAQRIANRANGAKSRGPVTPDGKAVSRLNAMKHGIYSELVIIEGETETDLVAFGKRLRAKLAPVGELELMLADKIVSTAWRLRRLAGIEAALFDRRETPAQAFSDYRAADKMLALGRYEAGLERALYKAMHELQRLQSARGETVPASVAIDVTVSDPFAGTTDLAPGLGSFLQNDLDDDEPLEAGESPPLRELLPIEGTGSPNDLGESGVQHGRIG
jgi:hypothetical protein